MKIIKYHHSLFSGRSINTVYEYTDNVYGASQMYINETEENEIAEDRNENRNESKRRENFVSEIIEKKKKYYNVERDNDITIRNIIIINVLFLFTSLLACRNMPVSAGARNATCTCTRTSLHRLLNTYR